MANAAVKFIFKDLLSDLLKLDHVDLSQCLKDFFFR